MNPNLRLEREFWRRGYEWIAGVDEVGRGAWAGPVVAGAIILPRYARIPRELRPVRDSKLLSPNQRQRLVEPIHAAACSFGLGTASHEEVDRFGIVPATIIAMTRALAALDPPPVALLIDALFLPNLKVPQRGIIHGDQLSLSIACASILAKVARDQLMVELEGEFPGYGFARHKGYGTAQHRAALSKLGASPAHRISFAPLRDL